MLRSKAQDEMMAVLKEARTGLDLMNERMETARHHGSFLRKRETSAGTVESYLSANKTTVVERCRLLTAFAYDATGLVLGG